MLLLFGSTRPKDGNVSNQDGVFLGLPSLQELKNDLKRGLGMGEHVPERNNWWYAMMIALCLGTFFVEGVAVYYLFLCEPESYPEGSKGYLWLLLGGAPVAATFSFVISVFSLGSGTQLCCILTVGIIVPLVVGLMYLVGRNVTTGLDAEVETGLYGAAFGSLFMVAQVATSR